MSAVRQELSPELVDYSPLHAVELTEHVQFEDEFLASEPPESQLTKWQINRLFGVLIVAQALTERKIFDDTPRLLGANDQFEPIETPNYKIRTMPLQTPQQKAHLNHLKETGEFVKGVHDKRTRLGSILEVTRLDEILTLILYPTAGVHKFWGNTRMITLAETKSPKFLAALETKGRSFDEFLKRYNPGSINTTQAFGVTELNTQSDFDILMDCVFMEPGDPDFPTKGKMVRGIAKDQAKKMYRKFKSVIDKKLKNAPNERSLGSDSTT